MKRVLVVDDEQSMRELLAIMLRKDGFDVVAAESRAQAAAVLARGPVDLIVTDVKLPDGDGIEILRHVKSAAPDTVVIVMTAFGSTETAVAALKLGAYDYLIKPFDVDELKIVVRNLIGNAFKFTKRGSVGVNVGFDPRAKTLGIAVRDTGAGIDPENLPKIFDMFHQAPNGVHRGGVGLGLYIVKRFVDLLGGHIEASSRLGEGSTFHFSLPAGVVAQPASLEEHRRRRSA